MRAAWQLTKRCRPRITRSWSCSGGRSRRGLCPSKSRDESFETSWRRSQRLATCTSSKTSSRGTTWVSKTAACTRVSPRHWVILVAARRYGLGSRDSFWGRSGRWTLWSLGNLSRVLCRILEVETSSTRQTSIEITQLKAHLHIKSIERITRCSFGSHQRSCRGEDKWVQSSDI